MIPRTAPLAATILTAAALTAAAPAHGSVEQINALRAAQGLPPAQVTPAARSLLAANLDRAPVTGDVSQDPSAGDRCGRCEFAELEAETGDGHAPVLVAWPEDLDPSGFLAARPQGVPALLSPRPLAAASETRDGVRYTVVAPLPGPVTRGVFTWPAGPVDPDAANEMTVLTTEQGSLTLDGGRGPGKEVPVTFRFTWWGVRGLLVIDGYGPVWSGRTYRLRVGGRAGVPFTAGRPARFRGPVRLHPSLGARGRQAVRTAVRGAHPQVRRMWSDLGGALTVRRGRCVVGSSCTTGSWPEGFTITMSARDIGPSRVQRRVLLHEFGHVVDRAGIPAHRRARFASTLVRRPGYRCRQPRRQDDVAACPPVGEWWAEEFARFADSYRGPSRSAYGTPPVFRQAEFARMLREWWEPGVTVVASAPGG